MRSTMVKVLGVFAVFAGALVASAAPVGAGGGGPGTLDIEPTYNREVPEWTFDRLPNGLSCEGAEYELRDEEGDVVDPARYEVLPDEDPFSGTIVGAGLDPSVFYVFEVRCTDVQYDVTYEGTLVFARLTVTKAVEGDAPADAEFVIEVDCEGNGLDLVEEVGIAGTFTEVIEFGPGGGSRAVIIYEPTACEVTETDDGGAESTTIEGGTADFVEDPADLETIVTNIFPTDEVPETPEAPETPETPTPPPTAPGQAPAARAVVAAPTFTG